MKSVLIQLDEQLYQRLNRAAPPGTRRRAQFMREAILRAVMEAEEDRSRMAYLAKPDSESEADDWSTAEEFQP
jgi:metal-responsive CopG/Arc/MetJ family transcriptional regulator